MAQGRVYGRTSTTDRTMSATPTPAAAAAGQEGVASAEDKALTIVIALVAAVMLLVLAAMAVGWCRTQGYCRWCPQARAHTRKKSGQVRVNRKFLDQVSKSWLEDVGVVRRPPTKYDNIDVADGQRPDSEYLEVTTVLAAEAGGTGTGASMQTSGKSLQYSRIDRVLTMADAIKGAMNPANPRNATASMRNAATTSNKRSTGSTGSTPPQTPHSTTDVDALFGGGNEGDTGHKLYFSGRGGGGGGGGSVSSTDVPRALDYTNLSENKKAAGGAKASAGTDMLGKAAGVGVPATSTATTTPGTAKMAVKLGRLAQKKAEMLRQALLDNAKGAQAQAPSFDQSYSSSSGGGSGGGSGGSGRADTVLPAVNARPVSLGDTLVGLDAYLDALDDGMGHGGEGGNGEPHHSRMSTVLQLPPPLVAASDPDDSDGSEANRPKSYLSTSSLVLEREVDKIMSAHAMLAPQTASLLKDAASSVFEHIKTRKSMNMEEHIHHNYAAAIKKAARTTNNEFAATVARSATPTTPVIVTATSAALPPISQSHAEFATARSSSQLTLPPRQRPALPQVAEKVAGVKMRLQNKDSNRFKNGRVVSTHQANPLYDDSESTVDSISITGSTAASTMSNETELDDAMLAAQLMMDMGGGGWSDPAGRQGAARW